MHAACPLHCRGFFGGFQSAAMHWSLQCRCELVTARLVLCLEFEDYTLQWENQWWIWILRPNYPLRSDLLFLTVLPLWAKDASEFWLPTMRTELSEIELVNFLKLIYTNHIEEWTTNMRTELSESDIYCTKHIALRSFNKQRTRIRSGAPDLGKN